MMTLDDLRQQIKEIPPLPDIAVRLLHMTQDPSSEPRDYVDIIKYDTALTAKILRLCNSAFFGLPRKITSLQECVVYLGVDAVVSFVLAGSLSAYCQKANQGYGLDPGQLWLHSVGCGLCAQKIAERSKSDKPATAFTAGLLHDLGKVVLNAFVAEDFRSILVLVEKYGMTFLEAERKIIGYNHAEAGAAVAESWSLPAELVDVLHHHHTPLESKEDQLLCAMVHVGDLLCISYGIGVGVDGLAYKFEPQVLDLLHLKNNDFYQISIEFHDAFKQTREALLL